MEFAVAEEHTMAAKSSSNFISVALNLLLGQFDGKIRRNDRRLNTPLKIYNLWNCTWKKKILMDNSNWTKLLDEPDGIQYMNNKTYSLDLDHINKIDTLWNNYKSIVMWSVLFTISYLSRCVILLNSDTSRSLPVILIFLFWQLKVVHMTWKMW